MLTVRLYIFYKVTYSCNNLIGYDKNYCAWFYLIGYDAHSYCTWFYLTGYDAHSFITRLPQSELD